ncbi:MAG: AMP-binding protein [Bacteroidales bacterium]|nr:AMP-binding protein [Candidatus Colicola faecequi]
MKHFLTHFIQRVNTTPDQPVLTDWKGTTNYTYATLTQQMTRIDALLTSLDVHEGDRVALCGRNSSNWGVAFLTLMASRRVAVSILPDFTPEGVRDLVNHSEAKLLFSGDVVWKNLTAGDTTPEMLLQAMPALRAIVGLTEFQPLALRNEADAALFVPFSLPEGSAVETGWWQIGDLNELCLINYTSGTTSSPKGVMLTYGNLSANVEQVFGLVDNVAGESIVSILPMAHMYGLCVEFLGVVPLGVHIHFISKTPTPTILAAAFAEIHPVALVCVPLVLEKIFRQKVLPIVKKPVMRCLMLIPGISQLLGKKIRNTIIAGMGGRVRYIVIGGAALNQEVETWMHRVKIPYIVGYGMTECGPLIAVSRVGTFDRFSCGRQVPGMELRIDSEDPQRIDGEILTRGTNVMLGYYKNEEATRATFTEDGWLRTGDLGVLNKRGDLFIRGRSKNMILGASGQNIYPEELEDKVNSIPGVVESVVLEREGHLIALIYADPIYRRRLGAEKLEALIQKRLKQINHELPMYSQIKTFEFVAEEFAKTPKRSIKRYLYK